MPLSRHSHIFCWISLLHQKCHYVLSSPLWKKKMLHNSMLRLLNWTEIIISQPLTYQKKFIWKYPPMKRYSPALYHELNGCAKTDFSFFFFSKLSFQNQCEVVPLQTLILAARWAHAQTAPLISWARRPSFWQRRPTEYKEISGVWLWKGISTKAGELRGSRAHLPPTLDRC